MNEKDSAINVDEATKLAMTANAQWEKDIGKDFIDLAKDKQVKEREHILAKHRNDLQQTLKSPEGRRTIWRILEMCGPYRLSFDATSARSTDYNEGQRSIGIAILEMLMDADDMVYTRMMNEAKSDIKTAAERRKKEMEDMQNGR